jgi:hypothetical protein
LDLGCFYDANNNNCYEKETSCNLYTDSKRCLNQYNGITNGFSSNFYFPFFFYSLFLTPFTFLTLFTLFFLFFIFFIFCCTEGCFHFDNVCYEKEENCGSYTLPGVCNIEKTTKEKSMVILFFSSVC